MLKLMKPTSGTGRQVAASAMGNRAGVGGEGGHTLPGLPPKPRSSPGTPFKKYQELCKLNNKGNSKDKWAKT